MLVRQRQAIRAVRRHLAGLETSDHALAAATIAGYGRHSQTSVGGNDPGRHQRACQRKEPGRIASGVADPRRTGDSIACAVKQLDKAEIPAFRRAMRRRGVDHPRADLGCQRSRFPRGVIGKAQDGDVACRHHLAPGGGVLALRIVECHRCDRRMRGETLVHLQAGRAGRAIDENAVGHRGVINRMAAPCKVGYRRPAMEGRLLNWPERPVMWKTS